jgi:phosphatidylglycerophosphate synthase
MQAYLDKIKYKIDKYFEFVAKPFIKLNISPNHISILCLIFGLVSVWFLFDNHYLFVLFMIIHLFFDKLDGVVARLTNKVTKRGEWIDYFIDQVVAIVLLAKAFFFLNPYLVVLTLLYFVIHHGVFVLTKNRKYLIGSRTTLTICFIFTLFNLGLLISVISSFFGILGQIIMFLKRKKNK